MSIYKGKGVDTDPSNYRPISLLNSIYKIFAAMLQARLTVDHGAHIRQSQYGFRAHKSTRHLLFILRRTMEGSQMTGNPIHLLVLDWNQALDSIDHAVMIIALGHLGVGLQALSVIESVYADPIFSTKGKADPKQTVR